MMRLLTVVGLLLAMSFSIARASEPMPKPVAEFLATRKVLVSVPFAPGSANLSADSQQTLRKSMDRLRGLDTNKFLLRIEGFTSPEGGPELNVNLAMERAREVEQYLVRHDGLPSNWSLTGIGVDPASSQVKDRQRRVDIVQYDNILRFDKLPTEKLTLH